jgi:hypothetical protein
MAAEFDFSEWADYNTKSAKTLQKAGITDYSALVEMDDNTWRPWVCQ